MFSKPLSQLLSMLVLACTTCVAGSTETITIIADEWCPYNCQPESATPGMGIEIAEQVFASAGIDVEYRLYPWTEALQRVREGKDSAVIGAFRTDAPDFIFPAIPFSFSRQCFYTSQDSDWQFKNISSLNGVVLGAIDGYSYGNLVDAYIRDHRGSDRVYISRSTAEGTTGLEDLITRMKEGSIDVLIEDRNVLSYDLADARKQLMLRDAGCFPSSSVYIAFSPATPDKSLRYIRLLDRGMRRMFQDGVIQKITSKYTVTPGRQR
jgi:polar amino acid transport system substrate-binding protein